MMVKGLVERGEEEGKERSSVQSRDTRRESDAGTRSVHLLLASRERERYSKGFAVHKQAQNTQKGCGPRWQRQTSTTLHRVIKVLRRGDV